MDDQNTVSAGAAAAETAGAAGAAAAADAGAAATAASAAAEGAQPAPETPTQDAGRAQAETKAAEQGEQPAPDDKAAPEEEAGTARAREVAALQQRLAEAELRGAAALAGVPREKVAYVARMADVSGIDMGADNARELIDAAVARVLGDVPELRGMAPAGTGGAGNFARKTADAVDPVMEKIRRNILGA